MSISLDQASNSLNRQLDEQKIGQLSERVEELRSENDKLKLQQEKNEKDTHEFVAYFQRELNKKDEMIANLTEQGSNDRVNYELEKKSNTKKFEAIISSLEAQLQETKFDLGSQLKLVKEDIIKLEVFRDRKDTLEKKLQTLELTIEKNGQSHKATITDLERKHIEEKSRIQKDTERKIEQIKQQYREEARNGLDADTRKIITDNKRMGEELRFQLLASDEQQRDLKNLQEANKKLTMELRLCQDNEKEYASQGQKQTEEIKQLKAKIKSLERSLTQVIHEFDKEKSMVNTKHHKELEDQTLDTEGLKRLIRLKNKELRNIRKLAHTILEQRTDVEKFFLEALEQIRKEISREKKEERMKTEEAYKKQMKQAMNNPRIKFPKIRTNFDPSTPSSNLPKNPNDKVELQNLTWEDKERVLRLLFAKINSIQGYLNAETTTTSSEGIMESSYDKTISSELAPPFSFDNMQQVRTPATTSFHIHGLDD